ncbi:hypothetical protein Tco_0576592 [Tanacetum coccineum]
MPSTHDWPMIGLGIASVAPKGVIACVTPSRRGPNIMFAVCACSRYQVNPKVSHLYAVKRIFKYLKGQPKLRLLYLKDSPFDLVAYTDSDYAGASLDRKSTTGGYQFLGSRLISWQCKKQIMVANSIIEAEYVAASSCCGQSRSSGDEEDLGEDASKQRRGRINAFDADVDIIHGKKIKDLKNKSFDSIKKTFDKDFKRVNTFVNFRTDLVEGSSKRAGEELEQESTKKQKVDEDKGQQQSFKSRNEVIPVDEEVGKLMLCTCTMLVRKESPYTTYNYSKLNKKLQVIMLLLSDEENYEILKKKYQVVRDGLLGIKTALLNDASYYCCHIRVKCFSVSVSTGQELQRNVGSRFQYVRIERCGTTAILALSYLWWFLDESIGIRDNVISIGMDTSIRQVEAHMHSQEVGIRHECSDHDSPFDFKHRCGMKNDLGEEVLTGNEAPSSSYLMPGSKLGGEFALSTLDVLQRFGFILQMGFTLILAILDGLDVGLLRVVIGEDVDL